MTRVELLVCTVLGPTTPPRHFRSLSLAFVPVLSTARRDPQSFSALLPSLKKLVVIVARRSAPPDPAGNRAWPATLFRRRQCAVPCWPVPALPCRRFSFSPRSRRLQVAKTRFGSRASPLQSLFRCLHVPATTLPIAENPRNARPVLFHPVPALR